MAPRRIREGARNRQSPAFFGALVFYTLVAAPDWTVAKVRLAVDAGLFAIALVSLAIGMPFTLQYARESVPQEFWSSPFFMTTNRRSPRSGRQRSAVMAAADAAAHYVEAIPLWIDIAATVLAFAAAIWFTRWSSAWARRVANPAAIRSACMSDAISKLAVSSVVALTRTKRDRLG